MDAIARLLIEQSVLSCSAVLTIMALGYFFKLRIFYFIGFIVSSGIAIILFATASSGLIVWIAISIICFCIFKLPVKEVIRSEYPSMM